MQTVGSLSQGMSSPGERDRYDGGTVASVPRIETTAGRLARLGFADGARAEPVRRMKAHSDSARASRLATRSARTSAGARSSIEGAPWAIFSFGGGGGGEGTYAGAAETAAAAQTASIMKTLQCMTVTISS